LDSQERPIDPPNEEGNEDTHHAHGGFRQEVLPILRHTGATIVVLLCVLAVGLVIKLLHLCLGPGSELFCSFVERIDLLVGFVAFCFFAMDVVVTLPEMTWISIRDRWPGICGRYLRKRMSERKKGK
jgi:hypothetical protein